MKAKAIRDILKPKEDDLILSDIMETDKENISHILQMHRELHMIYPKNSTLSDDKIIIINEIVEKYISIMSNPRNAGLLGLKRAIGWYLNGNYKKEFLIDMLNEWKEWVFINLIRFKKYTGRKYR